MALTASTMMALGTPIPEFSLPEVRTRTMVDSTRATGRPLLVIFMCRHCPYVIHVRDEIARAARDYMGRVHVIAVSSNDAANYPDDSPENLAKMADELDFAFPLCYDESQEVAKSFGAACTPEFYLFDADRKLAYRGQIDGSRPKSNIPVTGADLRAAMDALLAGKRPSENQIPSMGCNIKWKPGNQPTYYESALVNR